MTTLLKECCIQTMKGLFLALSFLSISANAANSPDEAFRERVNTINANLAVLSQITIAIEQDAKSDTAVTTAESTESLPGPKIKTESGYFRFGDVIVDFSYSYSFFVENLKVLGEQDTYIYLTTVPLDISKLNPAFDIHVEILRQIKHQDAGMAEMVITKNNSVSQLNFYDFDSGEHINLGLLFANYQTTKNDESSIDGRYSTEKPKKFFETTYEVDLRFSTKISKAWIEGDPLLKGGGEAGDACVSFYQALEMGEIATISKLLHPESSYSIEGSELDSMLRILKARAIFRSNVTVISGRLQENYAVLTVEGVDRYDELVRGRVVLQNTDEGWKFLALWSNFETISE